jgi:hypothetical protein
MSNAPVNSNTAPNRAQKISASDIHAKWDKISEQEASRMKNASELVAQVQAKYSLNPTQANTDVNAWTNGRSF